MTAVENIRRIFNSAIEIAGPNPLKVNKEKALRIREDLLSIELDKIKDLIEKTEKVCNDMHIVSLTENLKGLKEMLDIIK